MMLAGLGGVLIAPLFQLNDTLFTLVVLGSLFAVVVSGSLWGFRAAIPVAFAGGLLLGVVQNLVAGYGDDILPSFLNKLSGFRSAIPFILVVIVLLVIGRDRGRAAGSVADEAPLRDHREGLQAWRRRLPWALVTIALLAFSLQWIDVPWLQADAVRAEPDRRRHRDGDHLPVVRRRHRARRHGEPRPGDVRRHRRLRRRVGAQPRLGHRLPLRRVARADQLRSARSSSARSRPPSSARSSRCPCAVSAPSRSRS